MASEIVLSLGGETFVLKRTLDAYISVPAALGGFQGAFEKLRTADPSACILVVAAAIGKVDDYVERKRIGGLMMDEGIGNILAPLTEYVLLLSQPTPKGAEEKKGPPGE